MATSECYRPFDALLACMASVVETALHISTDPCELCLGMQIDT